MICQVLAEFTSPMLFSPFSNGHSPSLLSPFGSVLFDVSIVGALQLLQSPLQKTHTLPHKRNTRSISFILIGFPFSVGTEAIAGGILQCTPAIVTSVWFCKKFLAILASHHRHSINGGCFINYPSYWSAFVPPIQLISINQSHCLSFLRMNRNRRPVQFLRSRYNICVRYTACNPYTAPL